MASKYTDELTAAAALAPDREVARHLVAGSNLAELGDFLGASSFGTMGSGCGSDIPTGD